MKTACIFAVLSCLSLLSATAHAAPPAKAAVPPASVGKSKQPKPSHNNFVQKKLFDDTDTEDIGDALNLPPQQKLIAVRATVRDSVGKPPMFATVRAVDSHGGPVENPDLVYRVSSGGELDDQYPAAPTHYFVVASAAGCFDSAPQEISGEHDADLKFVLKRRPKHSRPHHISP